MGTGRVHGERSLAINAGSTPSPAGNPRKFFLWQSYDVSFGRFLLAPLPLGLALFGLLTALIPLAFPAQRIPMTETAPEPVLRRGLFWPALPLYPAFPATVDLGRTAVGGVYVAAFRRVLAGVDWLPLVVFALMFIALRLLASMQLIGHIADPMRGLPGEAARPASCCPRRCPMCRPSYFSRCFRPRGERWPGASTSSASAWRSVPRQPHRSAGGGAEGPLAGLSRLVRARSGGRPDHRLGASDPVPQGLIRGS